VVGPQSTRLDPQDCRPPDLRRSNHSIQLVCISDANEHQGDIMMTKKPVTIRFAELIPLTEKRILDYDVMLITSTANPPPSRRNSDVETLSCSIKWETEIDTSTLPIWTNPLGEMFYKLDYDVQMTCVGGTLDFSIHHNGKRYGSVNVVASHTVVL
jgi:hypothetical protein